MTRESNGYFSAQYGEHELLRLASSRDALDRWEAANALIDLDDAAATKIYRLLERDADSLVRKALANQRERFEEVTQKPAAREIGGPKGAFREAWSQPLGPLKRERLSEKAIMVASEFPLRTSSSDISVTFPQANSVETLTEMLDQIIDTNSIRGSKLGLVERQTLYYRDALRFLKLIELNRHGMITANAKIAQLHTPYQRLEFIIQCLLQSQSTSVAYLGLLGKDAVGDFQIPTSTKEYLVYFASSPDSRELSGSTLTRRAQTALAWATQILNVLGINVSEPASWKAAVPRFMRLNPGQMETE